MSQSPTAPDYTGEPLDFKVEWLSPVTNDFHSRSRQQTILFGYLRCAIRYLQDSESSKFKNNDDGFWKKYLETLKMLTALDATQPSPIRSSLANLWIAYLNSGNNTTIVTAASWLLEQLRQLNTQAQAVVFVECCALVFVEFRKILLPMSHECASHLIRFCQSQSTNISLAIIASEGLIGMTEDGINFLDKLAPNLFNKVCLSFIDSKSARLRINGCLLLVNLQRFGYVLGTLNRRSLKGKIEAILIKKSEILEEINAATLLLSYLTIYSGSNGAMQSAEKIVESWMKLGERLFDDKLLANIMTNILLICGNVEEMLNLILTERTSSFVLIPEAKKKIWRVKSTILEIILDQLQHLLKKDQLQDILTLLTKPSLTRKDDSVSETIDRWYLKGIVNNLIIPSYEELLNFPIRFSKMPDAMAEALKVAIAFDGPTQLQLLTSYFAQAKGDYTLLSSGDSSVSITCFQSTCIGVVALLTLQKSLNFPTCLYESKNLVAQINDFALSLTRLEAKEELEVSGWKILASMINKQCPSKDFITKVLSTRNPPSLAGTIDIGPLYYCHQMIYLCRKEDGNCLSFSNESVTRLADFVQEQWKSIGRLGDLSKGIDPVTITMLLDTTIAILPWVSSHIETAASITSRLVCQNHRLTFKVFDAASILLGAYLRKATVDSLKFHLSQFKAFSQAALVRQNIFKIIINILKDIKLSDFENEKDKAFILDILKDIIFPFVCERDASLQRQGAQSLGALVKLVNSRDFRDGMLQELIDRSLNEVDEIYRRGYILGIAHVYAALNENGSPLDMKLILGLLSSLAKDGRSLIVQAAALDALYSVLDARSNSVTTILSSDIAHLLWQIYTSEINSIPINSAVEQSIIAPIARCLCVLIEMVGPELVIDNTISRICKLLVSDLLGHGDCGIVRVHEEDVQVSEIIFDSVIQFLLLNLTFDDIPNLLNLVKVTLSRKEFGAINKALGCLRWLLEFRRDQVFKHDAQAPLLLIALLQVSERAGNANSNWNTCLEVVFLESIQANPDFIISLLLNCQVLKNRSAIGIANTPLISSSPHRDSNLLNAEEEATAAAADLANVKVEKVALGLDAALKLNECLSFYLVENGRIGEDWNTSMLTLFIDGIIRIAMGFIMLPLGTPKCQQLKLASLKLIKVMSIKFASISDPIDPTCSILDASQSQLVSVFSTGSNDNDQFVANYSLVALIELVALIQDTSISGHPKVHTLVKKAFESLQLSEDNCYHSEKLKLYCKISIIGALKSLPLTKLGNNRQEVLEKYSRSLLLECIDVGLGEADNDSLDKSIVDLIPCIVNVDDEYCELGSYQLLLNAKITPEFTRAFITIITTGKHKQDQVIEMILGRIVSEMTLNVALAIIQTDMTTVCPKHSSLLKKEAWKQTLLSNSNHLSLKDLKIIIKNDTINVTEFWSPLFLLLSDAYERLKAVEFADLFEILLETGAYPEKDLHCLICSLPEKGLEVILALANRNIRIPGSLLQIVTLMMREALLQNFAGINKYWIQIVKNPLAASIAINSADIYVQCQGNGKIPSTDLVNINQRDGNIVLTCLVHLLALPTITVT